MLRNRLKKRWIFLGGAFVVLCLLYLVSHGGIFQKLFFTTGTVDRVYSHYTHSTSSLITLYHEGTFSRKDYVYFFEDFYSGEYILYEGDIQFHYQGDRMPKYELTNGTVNEYGLSMLYLVTYNREDFKGKDGKFMYGADSTKPDTSYTVPKLYKQIKCD